jgi:hypothetical protein
MKDGVQCMTGLAAAFIRYVLLSVAIDKTLTSG